MTDILSSSGSLLSAIPYDDLGMIEEMTSGEFYEAAACFWTFRHLHKMTSPEAILLGDYAFGRFSYHLANIDSVPLTDAYAEFLAQDSDKGLKLEDYLRFLEEAKKSA